MIQKLLIAFLLLAVIILSQQSVPFAVHPVFSSNERILATHQMSLADRYPVPSVSDVFKDNILLTFSYMSGEVKDPSHIDWDSVRRSRSYDVTLQPGQVFAFHEDVLPEFQGKVVKTTNAHFNSQEGFKSDGYLVGDGVCHFASLINWAARDAGLKVVAPTNHNFAKIPEIAREYGTAIYFSPGESSANEQQNLYVENTFDKPVRIAFDYTGDKLRVTIYK